MTLPSSIGSSTSAPLGGSSTNAPLGGDVQVPVFVPKRKQDDRANAPVAERRKSNSSRQQAVPTRVELSGRKYRTIWGIPFDSVTLDQSIDRIEEMVRTRVPSYVITANLNYTMLHAEMREMVAVTDDADLIVADGQPIVWRSQIGGEPLPERVAGSDMIYRIAERATQRGWKIYFLGGESGVADKCANTLAQHYPGLQIAGVESPPFRELTAIEQDEQRKRIQDSGADVLLVAFGQPKGELWIHQHYQNLAVPVSIQLGASFDFVAGTAKRAPRQWQRFGAEWVHRMMSDPKRLVPRYAGNAWFLVKSIVNDWRSQVAKWGMWDSRQA